MNVYRVARFVLVGLVQIGIVESATAQGPPPTPPAPVRAGVVTQQEIVEARMVTGEIRSLRDAKVASQEAGVVTELLIEVGMRVEAGQVLARLDSDRLRLEHDSLVAQKSMAQATVQEEEASVDRWALEVKSLDEATQRGATNAREKRDGAFELRQAQARLVRAKQDISVFAARLALLDRRLGDMQITAPFAGTVTDRLTEKGEWVSAGDAVCEIVQTDQLEVVLDVPQKMLPVLAAMPLTGDDIVIRLGPAGERVAIDNVRIVPKIDERARTFELYARADNPHGGLAAGFSVIGYIPTGVRKEHLLVPIDAILRNELGAYVYVVTQMGPGPAKAIPVTVKVLFEIPGQVVVQSASLHAKDRVIVEGNQRLYPTAPVRVVSGKDTPEAGQDRAPETKPSVLHKGEAVPNKGEG